VSPESDTPAPETPAPDTPTPGTPTPGTPEQAPAATRPPGQPAHSFWLGAEQASVMDCHPRDLVELVARPAGLLWVHLDSTSPAQHALLEKLFRFHPLAIEDTLNPATRVKVEEYDGYLFLVMRGVRFNARTEDPYDLETQDLHAFLTPRALVTVAAGPSAAVTSVAGRLTRSPDLLARGLDRILHALFDELIDGYFPILEQVDAFVDGLEERVFVAFDDTALRDIFQVKRLVLSLRRHLGPQREVLATLTNRPTPLLTPATQLYFRDVYDHVLRISDSLDIFRDLLGSTMESYLTQVSNRLGATTKALSVLATLSLPFVVVSGMWGMNFDRIPLSGWPFGFWLMLAVQLLIGVGLLLLLRHRRIL
jgi:magnesium transporter